MARKEGGRGKNRRPRHHRVSGPRGPRTGRRHKGDDKTGQAAKIRSELEQVLGAQVIEQVSIERLRPNPRNARRHPEHQLEKMAANVDATKHMNPLVVDESYRVLAGHARLEVAKRANTNGPNYCPS